MTAARRPQALPDPPVHPGMEVLYVQKNLSASAQFTIYYPKNPIRCPKNRKLIYLQSPNNRRTEIKKERKRRGKFKTEQLRKETCMTRTTGACIRCQKNKIRVSAAQSSEEVDDGDTDDAPLILVHSWARPR